MHLLSHGTGDMEKTRNGQALVFPAPVIVEHASPYRRVLFDPVRDANPFFHYMEAIWMLSGGENVDFPARFASNIRNYSDDGITLHGAYGYRWRYAFELDQIHWVTSLLQQEPTTRRAVISMWDPQLDLMRSGLDLPCNTHIYFRASGGRLNMTVCNRSNDMVWGMLGANMVHMAALHEYVSINAGFIPGSYFQFTNNLHIYEDWQGKYSKTVDQWYTANPSFQRWPFCSANLDLHEAQEFTEYGLDTDEPYQSRILRDNAAPMLLAWTAHKDGDDHLALHEASHIKDGDWKEACIRWLNRRLEGKRENQEG
jgi:thymidylate synthase